MSENIIPAPADEPAPQLVPALNEDGEEEDIDSAYAGSIIGTATTSLKSSITNYREENGRTYHAYGSTEHWGPNDEKAQDQQNLSHHLWVLALKGKCFIAPVEDPQHILDLGTGTGIWVIDVADQYPQAIVKGIDLSPIQPGWIPQNAVFEIDDYNTEQLDSDKFDLIHGRELLGTVPNWVELYRKAYRALKPGGWFDQSEPSLFFVTDHAHLEESHPFPQWGRMMKEAGDKAGMRFDIGQHLKGWLEEAGFTNVQEQRMAWTIGGWSKDEHQREIGQWNQVRLDAGVKDFCSRRMTNQMEWEPEEIEVFCARLRNAFRDPKLYGYQWAYFVCGQKPLQNLPDVDGFLNKLAT